MDELVAVAAPVQAAASVQAEATPAVVAAPSNAAAPANAPAPATAAAPVASSTTSASTPVVDPAHKVAFPLRTTTTAQVAHPAAHTPADAGSIGGAVFSLLLVIGLILGLGWLAKRMPGMNRGAQSSQLKVVASVALGARERAVVLDVGGQQLLVGLGQGGVRTLHTLEHPLPVAESTAPSVFAQVLAQHFGKKS